MNLAPPLRNVFRSISESYGLRKELAESNIMNAVFKVGDRRRLLLLNSFDETIDLLNCSPSDRF